MRILMCGVAAIALSGCSWLGLGANSKQKTNTYKSYKKAKTVKSKNCCVGGKTLSRWNAEVGPSIGTFIGGDAITGENTHPLVGGQPGLSSLNINDVSLKDAYGLKKGIVLGASRALSPNRKITAQGFYNRANGNDVVWGSQNGQALRGNLSDYKTYGVEAGLRQYTIPVRVPLIKSVRPYVEGRLGASHVDDIVLENIRQSHGAIAGTPTSLAMTKGGWVPTAAGLVGLETPLFKRMTLGLETGIRYTGGLKSDNSDKAAGSFNANYAGLNNGGAQYSVPLTLRGRYRF